MVFLKLFQSYNWPQSKRLKLMKVRKVLVLLPSSMAGIFFRTFIYLLCMYVGWEDTNVPQGACRVQRKMYILGIPLTAPGLVAGACSHWTFSLAPRLYLFFYVVQSRPSRPGAGSVSSALPLLLRERKCNQVCVKMLFRELHSPTWLSENVLFLLGPVSPSLAKPVSSQYCFHEFRTRTCFAPQYPLLSVIFWDSPFWVNAILGKGSKCWLALRKSPFFHSSWFSILFWFVSLTALLSCPCWFRTLGLRWSHCLSLLRIWFSGPLPHGDIWQ